MADQPREVIGWRDRLLDAYVRSLRRVKSQTHRGDAFERLVTRARVLEAEDGGDETRAAAWVDRGIPELDRRRRATPMRAYALLVPELTEHFQRVHDLVA